jgi:hypothetical protein
MDVLTLWLSTSVVIAGSNFAPATKYPKAGGNGRSKNKRGWYRLRGQRSSPHSSEERPQILISIARSQLQV